MSGLEITVGGSDCSAVTVMGLSITESIGAPSSCSLEVVDLDAIWPQWLGVTSLAGVTLRIPGRTDYLFRGQMTNDKRAPMRPGMRHVITAEGYQRLLPKSLVGPLTDTPRSVVSDNDSSLINEAPYDTSVEGVGLTDGGIIADLLTRYWEGPTLDLSGIQEFKAAFDPPLRFSNVGIDAAVSAIQARTDPATTRFWVDEDGKVWYTALSGGYEIDLGDTLMGSPEVVNDLRAPYQLGMTFDGTTTPATIMPMSLEDSLEYGQIIRQLQVAGTTPWAVHTEDLGVGYLPYGGVESTSSSAITHEDARLDAWWGVVNRLAVRVSGTARISAGYDGWHVGQILTITDDDLYQDAGRQPMTYYFVIRTVGVEYITPGDDVNAPELEYTLTFGDAERRSFIRESKGPAVTIGAPAAVRAILVNVDTFDPAPNVGSLQLMRAWCADTGGAPMSMPNRTIRWTLFVNGADVGIGSESAIGWWFTGTWDGTPNDPGNTGINPDTNYAYIALNRGANSVDGDYCDVTAELLDEPA